jgi:rod shape-determining protein MreC
MIRDSRATRLVLGLLLVVALLLVTVDARAGHRLNPMRDAAAAVFGPLELAARAVTRPVTAGIGLIGRIGDQEARIARLERENAALRARTATAEVRRDVAAQLDALLGTAGRGNYRIVPARVVGFDVDRGFSWTVAIDAGTSDGVRRDMTVVNGAGLVGRVVSAGPQTATILLAADPVSSVGVRVMGSREIGTADGGGADPLTLRLLDQRARLQVGSRLVTFGSPGARPFVAGVPVGEIAQVRSLPGGLSQVATVRPYADFTALDVVGVVVQPPRTSPRARPGGRQP